ncbi:MAG: hypothetical protein Sapg2KO_30320 [Saprospiraceae bacterium]
MTIKSSLFFLLLLIQTVSYAQTKDAFLKKQFISSEGHTLPYRLLLPENYDSTQVYPLVLFLHGAGERGQDNEIQLVHGADLFLQAENRSDFPAIVVFPQCQKNSFWADADFGGDRVEFPLKSKVNPDLGAVIELLDQLELELSVDQNRMYVGGLSMGGFGTFEILARQPKRFAAAFPICGGGNPALAPLYASNLPFWVFHGDADAVVSVGLSQQSVAAIRRAGGSVRYSQYFGVNHNSWDNAFQEPNLLPWMFSQRRHVPKDRYVKQVFEKVEKQTHTYVTYAQDELQLDLYLPVGDVEQQRPLMIYVHGGGFSGGARDVVSAVQFAQRMARRGIPVASISYRLTMKGKSFSCDRPTEEKIRTFELAAEDIWQATQFLLSKQQQIGFSSQQIILAGSSAGAEAVLHAAYWQPEDINLTKALELPEDFKYGGVISFAGALVDTALITSQSAIPTLLYHGTCDNLVPFDSAPHHYCSEGEPGYLLLHGANAIAKHLDRLGKPFALYASCGGGHEWNDRPMFTLVQEMATTIRDLVVDQKIMQITKIVEQKEGCTLTKTPACSSIFIKK